ncbi:hypothetical protein SEA_THUNDERCLAP_79 [Arthrobacter phage Thunderclap]|uniref:Uncharacterized protein n=6 Tax=Amigovirus amigo TaxID=1982100 RepID=A0A5J6TBV2_9CAUD|nr:hypothetical protein FDH66_gp25 [Arthrobacter phage Amigo]QFG08371.1 hypothetical protein SEA_YEEZUS_79 [Arthrobacter phage Yeezus]QFG13420.1 hypothetical protein SEA_ICHOR_79 [Arthrobacter phage Ichor]QFG13938.1 hypothetical protein SEA_JAEK_79 [Arthrobacter phage Jaek]QJD51725.1 hypothetical protein SEA_BOERSMA_82 [Arthrobacter phage Boersma]QOR56132.1 hypothetical protein SEA_THUNDERCLAP_79 [Arthrobacter phage Thunderclap]
MAFSYQQLRTQEACLQAQMNIEISIAERDVRRKYAPIWDKLMKDLREAAERENIHVARSTN